MGIMVDGTIWLPNHCSYYTFIPVPYLNSRSPISNEESRGRHSCRNHRLPVNTQRLLNISSVSANTVMLQWSRLHRPSDRKCALRHTPWALHLILSRKFVERGLLWCAQWKRSMGQSIKETGFFFIHNCSQILVFPMKYNGSPLLRQVW